MNGYLNINGLGGSYGIESLEIGIKRDKGGRPFITTKEYPPEDISWELEWDEFINSIKENREVLGNYIDGLKANKVISAVYKSNRLNKKVILS